MCVKSKTVVKVTYIYFWSLTLLSFFWSIQAYFLICAVQQFDSRLDWILIGNHQTIGDSQLQNFFDVICQYVRSVNICKTCKVFVSYYKI